MCLTSQSSIVLPFIGCTFVRRAQKNNLKTWVMFVKMEAQNAHMHL